MRKGLWLLLSVVLVAVAVAGGRASGGEHAMRWRMVDLGSLGGGWSKAAALNARGQVVGTSYWKPGEPHVFLWQDGAMHDIGRFGWTAADIPLFLDSSGRAAWEEKGRGWVLWNGGSTTTLGFEVGAMNANGVLAGSDAAGRAVVWENGALRDLGRPLGPTWGSAEVSAINENGDVLGYSYRGPATRAFLVTRGKTYELGPTSGRPSGLGYAWAVNDRDQVLGETASYGVALWADGKLREISGRPPVWVPGREVLNNRGWVALGGASASLWVDGRIRDLGSFGGRHVSVVDLTDNGLLVGTLYGKGEASQAFAWRDGVATKLPSRGQASVAVAANERGQIIGKIGLGNMGLVQEPHAVLWTPVGG